MERITEAIFTKSICYNFSLSPMPAPIHAPQYILPDPIQEVWFSLLQKRLQLRGMEVESRVKLSLSYVLCSKGLSLRVRRTQGRDRCWEETS